MKYFVLLFLLLSPAFATEKIIVTGSSTIAPVLSDIAKAFEKAHKTYRVDVQTGGSSRGINDARKSLADIGMVSRALKAKESDLHVYLLAKDGLAIITHKNNVLSELTTDQIRNIYLGKITNWKELGGMNKKIVVVNKAEGRSTLELFLKFFKLKNSEIKASVVIGDNEQGIKTVSSNPSSIAYVSVGTAEYNQSVGVPIRLLAFKGIDAKVLNVEKGEYPLSRELNLVTKLKPSGAVKDFIDFATSKASHEIIREHYFVPIQSK